MNERWEPFIFSFKINSEKLIKSFSAQVFFFSRNIFHPIYLRCEGVQFIRRTHERKVFFLINYNNVCIFILTVLVEFTYDMNTKV